MSYSQFTFKDLREKFALNLTEDFGFFAHNQEIEPSDLLRETLSNNVPLAVAIGTEKARSELIVAPILVELRKHFDNQISLFSGVDFNVNYDSGLNGFCDFLISQSPQQLFIESPVIALVEAKNDNLKSGLAQCMAEMVAANIFNQQENNKINKVYGAVTTGTSWQFLSLQENNVVIDLDEYSLRNTPQILGILTSFISTTS